MITLVTCLCRIATSSTTPTLSAYQRAYERARLARKQQKAAQMAAARAAGGGAGPVRARSSVSDLWGTDKIRLEDMDGRGRSPATSSVTTALNSNGNIGGLPGTPNYSDAATAYLGTSAQVGNVSPPKDPSEEEEGDVDDDELEDVQRFNQYQANLPYGKDHPDPLVEAASLALCHLPPITYVPKLYTDPAVRAKVIDSGALSKVQLESIVYACQRHNMMLPDGKTRAGFFVGDGAGVGKGRTIAGVIYEVSFKELRRWHWMAATL